MPREAQRPPQTDDHDEVAVLLLAHDLARGGDDLRFGMGVIALTTHDTQHPLRTEVQDGANLRQHARCQLLE